MANDEYGAGSVVIFPNIYKDETERKLGELDRMLKLLDEQSQITKGEYLEVVSQDNSDRHRPHTADEAQAINRKKLQEHDRNEEKYSPLLKDNDTEKLPNDEEFSTLIKRLLEEE